MTPSAMTATAGEFRAAGTDLSERRRSGVSTGPLIDIAAQPDMTSMLWGADGTLRIGAVAAYRPAPSSTLPRPRSSRSSGARMAPP